MQSPSTRYLQAWFARPTLIRAVKVSTLVGTLLLVINQGDLVLSGMVPPPWKVLLTYIVPYAVSSWSSVAALRQTGAEDQQSTSSSSSQP